MEKQRVSEEQKENIRQMLQDQQERSRERMVKLGQSSDETVMFGAIGRRGTAAVLMLLGCLYILGGIILLNSQAQFPLAAAIFALVWGLILVTIGILSKFKYKPLIFDFIKVSIGAGLVI
ncbi:hypothetical protein IH992_34640 [Candidatus Poribacteria bacterium]|nr:hypothetical protein [Candidatus Poribacteria bacterium]